MIHFLCPGLNNLLVNLRFGSNNLLDYKEDPHELQQNNRDRRSPIL